jgi:chromosome segregation ATPase
LEHVSNEQVCRVCDSTQNNACPGNCWWGAFVALVAKSCNQNQLLDLFVMGDYNEMHMGGKNMENEELLQAIGKILDSRLEPIDNRLAGLEKDVSGLKQDVSGLKQGQATMQQDVSGLKQDVSGLKQGQATMQQDVSGLKQDVSGLKQDISGLKQGQAALQEETHQIKMTLENVTNKNIQIMMEGHSGLVDKVHELSDTMDDIDTRVDIIDMVSRMNMTEIKKLKTAKV